MTRQRIPDDVLTAAHARARAREARDWQEADRLRAEIEAAGWNVADRGTDFALTPAAPPDLDEGVRVRYGSSATVPSRLEEPVTGLATIVIVLDNGGYGTERFLHPGTFKFNDIQPWAYHKLPDVYGGGTGYEVRTEGEFDAALKRALADTRALSLIQVHLDPADHSTALARLTEKLGQRV